MSACALGRPDRQRHVVFAVQLRRDNLCVPEAGEVHIAGANAVPMGLDF